MNIFTIDLPTRDNNNVDLAVELSAIYDDVARIAGGLTLHTGIGMWRSEDGTLYRDEVMTVRTYADDSATADLVALVPAWRDSLRQLALVYSVSKAGVHFV